MEENIIELNNLYAYIKDKPIIDASQMLKKLTWDKIDDEWNKSIKEKFWHTEFSGDLKEHVVASKIGDEDKEKRLLKILELRDKLLTFGGDQACMPSIEEDLEKIINRGQLFYGDRIKIMKGLPSQCHYNSTRCWDVNSDKTRIVTGYALSFEGLWTQHSWLVWNKPRKNIIIETTKERAAYFGFVMTEEECNEFYFNN